MNGHGSQSEDSPLAHNFARGTIDQEESLIYGTIVPADVIESIPYMAVLGEDRVDPTLRYRRHLTLEELMFAWNAVIVYIMCMISIMCFTIILLLCLYGDKLFSDA